MSDVCVKIAPYLLSLLLGLGIGELDLHAREVQGPVLLLLLFGLILGCLQSKGVWLSGLLLGSGILLAHILARACGKEPYQPQPNIFATLLAVVPALIGVAIGVGLRALLSSPGPEA